MPIIALLGITFVALKLAGVIDWPWWLVLAPFWAGIALTIGLILSVGAGALGFFGLGKLLTKWWRPRT